MSHSQGTSLDELHEHLQELVSMLLEDAEPVLEAETAAASKPAPFANLVNRVIIFSTSFITR